LLQYFTTTSTLHIAIIMDGNGRWAQARGLPRLAGHRAGERALRRIVECAPSLDVGTLTVYAFSSDNWKRPPAEVCGLMRLLETHMAKCLDLALNNGVRITVIGRRDRIPEGARRAIEFAEEQSRAQSKLHLRIAIDYSSRDALLAILRENEPLLDRESVAKRLGGPEVDLLIRTGGEQRLSDFLLWECAYAELLFTPCLWPDFGPDQLNEALGEFRRRERRYGALPGIAPAVGAISGVVQSRG
jgi:undecaprenyl diphosphate synthase